MKATIALALFCLVGVSACSTTATSSPGTATCACGKKVADCACDSCKGGSGAGCDCAKGKVAKNSPAHTGGDGELHCTSH
jgi:hypothetical protein